MMNVNSKGNSRGGSVTLPSEIRRIFDALEARDCLRQYVFVPKNIGRVTDPPLQNIQEEGNIMQKIMAIDYGDARTGVAISDLLCSIVGSTAVVPSRNTEKAIADIVKLCKDNMVGRIIVGLPRNMDGTEGTRAELCREFAARLGEAAGLPVQMWDERRITVEAHNILSQHNYHGKKRKNTVDAVAASLILEGYLNSLK